MASYYRDLAKYLTAHGCYQHRQGKGSHEIWFSPLSNQHFTVPMNIQNRKTAMAICKQAGVSKPDWL